MRSCGRALLAVVIALSIAGTTVSASGAGPKGRFKVKAPHSNSKRAASPRCSGDQRSVSTTPVVNNR